MAQPGEVVVATRTRQLIGARFDLQPLGATTVKGIAQPVEAWRVVGARPAASLFEAQNPDELVRFVGRDSEVSLLLERWAMGREGEGQVLLLSGEAGIGKSRISQTLRERLADEPHAVVLWQCSPYFGSSALHPVIQWLERMVGVTMADPLQARVEKVEGGLARLGAMPEPAALGHLLRLLGLPDGGRAPPDLPPPQEKARTLDALVEVLHRVSQVDPLLCLVEDAHWIDPTTDELLGRTIDRLRDARELVLVTSRPEYTPPWASAVNLTRLPLSRLGQRQCAALVASVAYGKTLPDEVVAEIVRKTDGIPLFVGELTKTVLQSGLLVERPGGYELSGPLSALAIPSTLQDSLMARLDRLGAAKEAAQVGAAIGREFPHRLIAEVTCLSPEQLDERLGALQGAELLYRRGSPPDAVYVFKHALVRDTAYGSMVKSQRVLRHGQIATAIESIEPAVIVSQPELLAFHWQEAGNDELAIGYWERAGGLALSRSAGVEATADFDAALSLVPKEADGAEAGECELGLRLKRGYALIISQGPFAPAFVDNAERALELARALERPEEYVNACVDFAATRFAQERVQDVLERVWPSMVRGPRRSRPCHRCVSLCLPA